MFRLSYKPSRLVRIKRRAREQLKRNCRRYRVVATILHRAQQMLDACFRNLPDYGRILLEALQELDLDHTVQKSVSRSWVKTATRADSILLDIVEADAFLHRKRWTTRKQYEKCVDVKLQASNFFRELNDFYQ
jgi:hypothetical protein